MRYDLADLKLLIDIAEAGSLTRGAERSFMSVPTASLRLKALEDFFGVALFERHAKGMVPTLAGQTVLKNARLIRTDVERLNADMAEHAGGTRGSIRLLANTNAINSFLPESLAKFLADNPLVDVDLQEHWSSGIALAVMEGTADIGIMAAEAESSHLQVFPYREDRLVFIAAETHPAARQAHISFRDTLENVFVSLENGAAIQTFLRNHAERLGQRMKVRIQVRTFDAVCRLVAAGVGVGIVPATATAFWAERTGLACLPLTDEWAVRRLKICVKDLRSLPVFAQSLVKHLMDDRAQ